MHHKLRKRYQSTSGGKPPFLTCKLLHLEPFNSPYLTGKEGWLAPAVLFIFTLFCLAIRYYYCFGCHFKGSVNKLRSATLRKFRPSISTCHRLLPPP